MKLSIVTTIYKSAQDIIPLFNQSVAASETMGAGLEMIFVNDGSPDNGIKVAQSLAMEDSRVVVIDLSRNYGQAKALWTGMEYASGDLVALLDGDLEEDPRWLVKFHETMQSACCDVVYGVQVAPKGSAFYRIGRNTFYGALKTFTATSVPANGATIRLMSRRYVEALKNYQEREIFLFGIMHVVGFAQIGVAVEKHPKSQTTYNIPRLAAIFINGVTSFSTAPLTFIFLTGLSLSLAGALFSIYLLLGLNRAIPGWLSVMSALTFFSGVIILFLGIIAVYIGTIFLEVKRRPMTIIKEIIRRPKQ